MNVLVVGLGVTGECVVRRALARGDRVVVVEDEATATHRTADARDRGAEVLLAPDEATLRAVVAGADLVVPSPGVRPSHPVYTAAADTDVVLRSEIDLAMEDARSKARPEIVAVTGTNGKTTVTALLAAVLDRAGRRVAAAGNIGRPLLDAVHDDVDLVVAEVSSFQLEYTSGFGPRVAVLLNIADDHLDWHPSIDAYVAAKARVFAGQGGDDVLVYNADDERVRGLATRAPARRCAFSLDPRRADAWRPVDDAVVDPAGVPVLPLDAIARGRVDRSGVLATIAAADTLGVSPEHVAAELEHFTGFPHRLELVGEASGVRYVDDSKATNPHAAVHAAQAFDDVVLLAGGRNKGLDLTQLRAAAPRLRGVVAFGEAADEVDAAFAGSELPVARTSSLTDAVRRASVMARAGDVVLLSPGCASFDAYPSYAARGDDFARSVAELPGFRAADEGPNGDRD